MNFDVCVHVEYTDICSVCVYVFMGDNAKCNSCFSLAKNSAFVAAQASHYRAGVTPKNPPLDRLSACHFLPLPAEQRHWQAIVPGRA